MVVLKISGDRNDDSSARRLPLCKFIANDTAESINRQMYRCCLIIYSGQVMEDQI